MAAPSTSTRHTTYHTFSSEETAANQTIGGRMFRALTSAVYSCCPDIAAYFSHNTSLNERRIHLERLTQAAYAPMNNQAIQEECRAFCKFVDTTIKAKQQDLQSALTAYISERLFHAQETKKCITFKTQLICTFAQALCENQTIKKPQPLLNILKREYKALIFEFQNTTIDIHDNIDHYGMVTSQKIEELQTMFEYSIRQYIMDNPEAHQQTIISTNCYIPTSCVSHLERNIPNNNYYLTDSQKPEQYPLLPSTHTPSERKKAIRPFAEKLALLLNHNENLKTTICQHLTEDMGFALTAVFNGLLSVLLGPQTVLLESTPTINTAITKEKPASLGNPDDFVVTMKFCIHPVLNRIHTDAFGNTENLSQIREEWSGTKIWAEAILSFRSRTPDAVHFEPLQIHLTLP